MVLVGDAGGYVDASTGEGITLALAQAEQLLEFLPRHLPARLELSRDYVRARHRLSRGYRLTTYGSLALSRFPFLRRAMIGCLSRDPNLFQALLSVNMGSLPVHSFFLRDGLRFLARSVLGQ